jgi:hypothetical protein
MLALAAPLGAVGVLLALAWLTGGAREPILIPVMAALLASAAWFCAYVLRCATVLTADAVERRGVLGSRRMLRTDIAGYRVRSQRNWYSFLILEPTRPDVGRLRIVRYRPDSAFNRWFDGIPDLDQQELQASEDALLSDVEFGATAAERSRTLESLRRLGGFATIAGMAIFAWNVFLPVPHGLPPALGVMAPWIAVGLVRWSGGRLTLFYRANDARPYVGGLLVAGWGSSMWAGFNTYFYHWQETLAPGAICGCVFFVLVAALDSRVFAESRHVITLAACCLIWGWGDAALADRFADRAPPQVFETVAGDKYVSSGRWPTPYLKVAVWGDRRSVEDISVDRATYDATAIPSVVCIRLHKGALGVRWFDLGGCPG